MNEKLSRKALAQWESGNLGPCKPDCTCKKHRPNRYAAGKCESDCVCGRHKRSKEHNEKIRQARLRYEQKRRKGIPVRRKDIRVKDRVELNAVEVIHRLYEPRKVTQK